MSSRLFLWLVVPALLTGCGDDTVPPDSGSPDATTQDGPDEATASDAGEGGGPVDAPNVDATPTDGGIVCGDIPDGGATCNGTFFQCDDSADCTGQLCCLIVSPNGIAGSSCRPSCKAGVPQLCSGTPECASGTCATQTCKGYVLGICGTAPAVCN